MHYHFLISVRKQFWIYASSNILLILSVAAVKVAYSWFIVIFCLAETAAEKQD